MRSWSSRQISFCRCIYCCQRKKLLHIFILSNEVLLPVPADLSIRIPPAMSTAACQLLCTANIVFCRSFAHLIYQPRAASSHAFSSLSAHWLLCRQMREQLGSCFGVCLCKAETLHPTRTSAAITDLQGPAAHEDKKPSAAPVSAGSCLVQSALHTATDTSAPKISITVGRAAQHRQSATRILSALSPASQPFKTIRSPQARQSSSHSSTSG